jgi:microcin C transport system permease protein
MIRRTIGILWVLTGVLALVGEFAKIAFPTARWFFNASRELTFLHLKFEPAGEGEPWIFPWFGWVSVLLLILAGLVMIIRSFTGGPPNPMTLRKLKRFRQIRRGYISLIILLGLAGLAALDQVVVGKRALAVYYNGEWIFPAFMANDLKNSRFGETGENAEATVDYRELKRKLTAAKNGRVIMPLIPFDPTGDTLPPRSRPLVKREGVYQESGSRQPYSGLVARYHDATEARAKIHLRMTMRNGKLNGPAEGWNETGDPVYSAVFRNGAPEKETYIGESTRDAFFKLPTGDYRAIKYHPAPPIPSDGHFLGTTSQGSDVVAYLFGGLQVNFKAALIYLPIVYLIGVSLGLLMGFFGGWFDLLVQRLIEIFSNMPFLFVVIILSSMVPEQFKGLPVILTILILFGWMGMTYLMRTAAYRDKERDYIAATRVLGASTPRILFRHLLPNTVAIIVTVVPFSMSGLIFSLTALDYLGFGLPPRYATWGRLLQDGLSNLSSPWLVTSTFTVLVATLVLITFVGEAVREAFDPKKFTYYR